MPRRRNPLTPGPPPTYRMGGLGSPTVWEYRGRDITIYPPGAAPNRSKDWMAQWSEEYLDPPEKHKDTTYGVDEQSALANARFTIDVHEKEKQYPGYHVAETMVNHIIDAMAMETGPISRATVARRIEDVRRHILKYADRFRYTTATGSARTIPVSSPDIAAFNNLTLPERLKLIDEVIAYQSRYGLLDPKRLVNPKKPRKKKPERSKRAIMQRLLRGL